MKLVESEMRHESAKLVKRIEEETQIQADKKAKEEAVDDRSRGQRRQGG